MKKVFRKFSRILWTIILTIMIVHFVLQLTSTIYLSYRFSNYRWHGKFESTESRWRSGKWMVDLPSYFTIEKPIEGNLSEYHDWLIFPQCWDENEYKLKGKFYIETDTNYRINDNLNVRFEAVIIDNKKEIIELNALSNPSRKQITGGYRKVGSKEDIGKFNFKIN